jgi:predicted nucleic acid-binding protein
MALVVFDSDVLIGFLNRDDAHHARAVDCVRDAMTPGTRRWICAFNYTEIMVGPLRAGRHETVDQMLTQLGIETIEVDMPLARRAAAVRARTDLKLPDAFALATVIHAEKRGWEDVRFASFDRAVTKAYAKLHPRS